jgi:hypothetical protein
VVESLKRLREPAAFVVLVALGVRLLLGVVSLFVLATDDRLGSFTAASRSVANWITDPLTAVVLFALVASCVLVERTPRARLLTWASLIVVATGVVLTLLLALIGVAAQGGINRAPSFLVFLADLAVPALAAVGLYRLYQGQPAPARPQALPAGSPGGQPASYWPGSEEAEQPQPTWQPDQAAGAAWNTAGEAATGAAASGWGTPGESGGWSPVPRSQPPQQWSAPQHAGPQYPSPQQPSRQEAGPQQPSRRGPSPWDPSPRTPSPQNPGSDYTIAEPDQGPDGWQVAGEPGGTEADEATQQIPVARSEPSLPASTEPADETTVRTPAPNRPESRATPQQHGETGSDRGNWSDPRQS